MSHVLPYECPVSRLSLSYVCLVPRLSCPTFVCPTFVHVPFPALLFKSKITVRIIAAEILLTSCWMLASSSSSVLGLGQYTMDFK